MRVAEPWRYPVKSLAGEPLQSVEGGLDRRRFRPNILVAGVDELAERAWPGRRARIGQAVAALQKLRVSHLLRESRPG